LGAGAGNSGGGLASEEGGADEGTASGVGELGLAAATVAGLDRGRRGVGTFT